MRCLSPQELVIGLFLSSVLSPTTEIQPNPAPLRVPNYMVFKINLVADYSPGGSPAGTPLLGPCGPRSPLGRGVGYPPRVTVGI